MTISSDRRVILFDLYGTLVPGATRIQRDAVSFSMAEVLGVASAAFADTVRATFDGRVRGAYGSLEQTIERLAHMVGATPSRDQIARAADLRLAFTGEQLGNTRSQKDLVTLKSQGVLIGVVTDCSVETPSVWGATWLNDVVDAVAFSCELGMRKPDPGMYLSVTRKLNVEPEECLFVGDGGSTELSGARKLGMEARKLEDPGLPESDRVDEELDWHGEVIHSLAELFNP